MKEPTSFPEKEIPLYRKNKKVDISFLPARKQFRIAVEMEDGVHHLRLRMEVQHPVGRIVEIECDMPGVPDEVCREAQNCLDGLVGRNVAPGLIQELDRRWAQTGCTHLKSLFYEACYTLPQAQLVLAEQDLGRQYPGISEEQLYKIIFWFRPDILDSCIRYTEETPFMKKVREAGVPEGAEKLRAVAKSMRK